MKTLMIVTVSSMIALSAFASEDVKKCGEAEYKKYNSSNVIESSKSTPSSTPNEPKEEESSTREMRMIGKMFL